MAGKDGGQQLANAAKAAAASAMAPWIGTIILAVTLILIIIFAFAAATSLTKFGLIPPESGNAARAPGVGTGPGSSGRFNEQSKTKPCQDLYSRVAKYGVSMEYFYRAADKWQIPLSLLVAQAEAESAFNPNAYNPSGATGIIQILPGTWGGLYSKADGLPNDQRNAESSLYYGAKYMHQNYKQFGNWDLALAAYNAGPGNVQKYHGIPPFAETQNYVKKINANAQTKPRLAARQARCLLASCQERHVRILAPILPTSATLTSAKRIFLSSCTVLSHRLGQASPPALKVPIRPALATL